MESTIIVQLPTSVLFGSRRSPASSSCELRGLRLSGFAGGLSRGRGDFATRGKVVGTVEELSRTLTVTEAPAERRCVCLCSVHDPLPSVPLYEFRTVPANVLNLRHLFLSWSSPLTDRGRESFVSWVYGSEIHSLFEVKTCSGIRSDNFFSRRDIRESVSLITNNSKSFTCSPHHFVGGSGSLRFDRFFFVGIRL